MYKTGHKHSKETLKKLSIAKVGKIQEKCNAWKGNNISYCQKHKWLVHVIGKPKICSVCGIKSGRVLEWANISLKYKRELSDYIELCRSCHRRWDFGLIHLKIDDVIYKRPIVFKHTKGFTEAKHIKNPRRWVSQCSIDGKHYHLGLFKSKKQAINCFKKFKKNYKPVTIKVIK